MIITKNTHFTFVIILLLIAITACSSTPSKNANELSLSTARYGHAVVNDGQKIYVFAGGNKSGFLSDIEIIEPTLEKTKVLPNKLIPRRYFSAVWDGEHSIYIIGGVSFEKKYYRFEPRVEVFNTITHEISFAPPLPTPTRINTAVLLSGRIYVFGGAYSVNNKLKASSEVTVFSIEENRWMQAAPMPTAKATRAIVKDGEIYVVGGYNQTSPMNVFEKYDPKLNAWQALPAMPVKISAHSLSLVKDTLFVFGNYNDLTSSYAYSFRTEQWKKVELGYQASRHNAATTLGDTTYVIGGNLGRRGPFLDYVQIFKL